MPTAHLDVINPPEGGWIDDATPFPTTAIAVLYAELRDLRTLLTTQRAELLDVTATAAMLDISASSVWRLTSAGCIVPPVRIGGNVRWRRADLLQWIDDGCPTVGKKKK